MRDNRKYFPVNWIDGMKINKNHFIDQDNAFEDALQESASLNLSPLRYGILPVSTIGQNTFSVNISLDNQESVRVSVLACNAVTSGGVIISLLPGSLAGLANTGNLLTSILPFANNGNDTAWWIFLFIHPSKKQPTGSADMAENPPRLPFLLPTYTTELVSNSNYIQYANHPYALAIGKVILSGSTAKVDSDYLPPCFSVHAHPDLISLHGELDKYLGYLELYTSQIIQKIFKRNQQNEISELVMFLCDRVVQYLSLAITEMRWKILYEPPAAMFMIISSLARLMKNAIDMRIGSGKDELMNYLTEWCELKQGELEGLLANMANSSFDNNDINKNIEKIIVFVKVTARLFETLSKLEYIGKKKESGIFVKEEPAGYSMNDSNQKPKRRFFG